MNTEGFCKICGRWKFLTKHHLIGVRDIKKLCPEATLKKIHSKVNPLSPVILVCRECHNNLEHNKKVGRISAKNL